MDAVYLPVHGSPELQERFLAPLLESDYEQCQRGHARDRLLACSTPPPPRGGERVRIRRLKDKLGTRALATGEIEFTGALGHAIGAPEEHSRLGGRGASACSSMEDINLKELGRAAVSCSRQWSDGRLRGRNDVENCR